MSQDNIRSIRPVRSAWTDVVLVCRKCSKKLDGGYGRDGDEKFAKAMRRSLAGESGRKIKAKRARTAVVEVDCLDICPKGGVVAMRAKNPGDWLVIPRGTPISAVVDRLGLTPSGMPDTGEV